MDMQHKGPSTRNTVVVLAGMDSAHQLDRTQHERLYLESHKLEVEELDWRCQSLEEDA